MSTKEPIPMVSTRKMPVRVVDLLNETLALLEAAGNDPRVREIRVHLTLALGTAERLRSIEDRDEAARRRFVEEARS